MFEPPVNGWAAGGMTMTQYRLQTILFVVLAAVATGANGCGGSSRSCSANVTARWVVTENGVQVSCLPGDEVDINVGDMTATFACSAMAGTTPALAGGLTYAIDLTLFDASSNVLSQTQSMNVFLPCGVITDIGQVEFSLTP